MSKHRSIAPQPIVTSDWLERKVYHTFDAYDGFYLKLANQVFALTAKPAYRMPDILDRQARIDLSLLLVDWFEDFISGIGLWKYFQQTNRDLHGFYLPFYDLCDYDPDDFNQQDIAYLIWHFCVKTNSKLLSPTSPGLLALAAEMYELFDQSYESAPATDFYEKLLTFDENAHFFELKGKLDWVAFHSYLFIDDFDSEYVTELDDLMRDDLSDHMNTIAYHLKNRFLFKSRNSYQAQSAPEMLAAIARCPDSIKQELRQLHQLVEGEFVFERWHDGEYILLFPKTGRRFYVPEDSTDMQKFKPDDQVFCCLAPWKGRHYTTGMVINQTENGTQAKDKTSFLQTPFYAWDAEHQQQITENTASLEQHFIQYFGSPLAVFPDAGALENRMTDFYRQFNKNLGESDKGRDFTFKSESNRSKPVAIFFEHGEGFALDNQIPEMLALLQAPELSADQTRKLFYWVLAECSPTVWQYLQANYPLKNLQFPMPVEIPLMPHLYFLQRFFSPETYEPLIPRMHLV